MSGRPSKYSPAYCDEVIQHMAEGYSLEAFAGVIGVAPSTVYLWQNEHEAFSEAIKIGRAKAALIWEKRLASLATTGQGNATAVIFALKNRFPDQWRDRQEVDQTVRGDLKHEHSTVDRPPHETREEWIARRQREMNNVGASTGAAS